MGILANENSISAGGYTIERSLRFQSASTQYLSRTQTSGNRRTWTWSAWFKRGTLGVDQKLFGAGNGSTNLFGIGVGSGNLLEVFQVNTTTQFNWNSTQVLRDPSAWYHIVVVLDTAQATASNRLQVYLNGSLITANNGSYPALNFDTWINFSGYEVNLGRAPANNSIDGYLAEVNFIDGQALTPSSFGETDTLTGVWVAKKYTGTYGTNGFYLPFSNGTSTTTLGADSSGNGNNWTLTNFTRSAGVSDCWMKDVPSGNGGASATQPSSNYAVISPLSKRIANLTLSNANLRGTFGASGQNSTALSTISFSAGKWYFEAIDGGLGMMVGIMQNNASNIYNVMNGAYYVGQSSTGYGYYSDGTKFNNASASAYGASFVANDVIGIAYDADVGTLTFYKNGVSQGNAFTGITGEYFFAISGGSGGVHNVNFGQRSFAYTPPSGFKALCTANLPASTIVKGNQYMDATLYTGDGASSKAITNAGSFSPDFVWIKNRARNDADPYYGVHMLFNTVTGVGNRLMSQSTAAESFSSASLTAFNSNGFTVGNDLPVNRSGDPFVAWQWDAGSSTVTNTSGSISSQVRANTTAGFSIVTYTGTGSNATVGHGLGVAPKMIITKGRDSVVGATNWSVYHASIGNTQRLVLNSTAAAATVATIWNNTSPTSTVFSLGTNGDANGNTATYVAYCFAEISGFSKVFSYAGNGSTDGTFVYTGFRPKFIMIKEASGTNAASASWQILDTSRNPSNVSNTMLYPNLSGAEGTGDNVDILSNGFKLRASGYFVNESGGTYIGIAFAENPFNYSNAR